MEVDARLRKRMARHIELLRKLDREYCVSCMKRKPPERSNAPPATVDPLWAPLVDVAMDLTERYRPVIGSKSGSEFIDSVIWESVAVAEEAAYRALADEMARRVAAAPSRVLRQKGAATLRKDLLFELEPAV